MATPNSGNTIESAKPTNISLNFRVTHTCHSKSEDNMVFCSIHVFVYTDTVSPNYLTFKISRRLYV